MDFRREAIDKLKYYDAKRQSLQRVTDEIKRLEEDVVRIRSASADSMSVSGSSDGREAALVNNIALRSELARAQHATAEWLRIVDDALDSLDHEERLILERMYIRPVKGYVENLCGELHIEKSALYTRKSAAIRRFTLALYGVTEL